MLRQYSIEVVTGQVEDEIGKVCTIDFDRSTNDQIICKIAVDDSQISPSASDFQAKVVVGNINTILPVTVSELPVSD